MRYLDSADIEMVSSAIGHKHGCVGASVRVVRERRLKSRATPTKKSGLSNGIVALIGVAPKSARAFDAPEFVSSTAAMGTCFHHSECRVVCIGWRDAYDPLLWASYWWGEKSGTDHDSRTSFPHLLVFVMELQAQLGAGTNTSLMRYPHDATAYRHAVLGRYCALFLHFLRQAVGDVGGERLSCTTHPPSS